MAVISLTGTFHETYVCDQRAYINNNTQNDDTALISAVKHAVAPIFISQQGADSKAYNQVIHLAHVAKAGPWRE